ncbi:hypothetical protein [Tahibacter sp.]|uniref:hypothetical protein n=1 Tax=Tahibacter sp. TaxID=2056211 RepID=UPI0028C4CCCC|nr:hypothetical protein [Tahibacter sp.]
MKGKLISALLACSAAPLAHAQSWTQVIQSAAPEQFLSLAPERSLAMDGAGLLFVQTRNLSVSGPASIDVHALNAKGARLTWLTSALPIFNDGTFMPRGVSARDGDRVNWVESGPDGARVPRVFVYRAGETTRYRSLSFQGGITVTHAISGGGGGVYIARLPAGHARPMIQYYGAGTQFWSRDVRGCAAGPYLPAALLALDVDLPSNTLTTVSRCLHVSAPGAIAVETFDAVTGSPLATRYGWPYADSAAPVVAAQPIGNGAFVLEQHDVASGERVLRRVDIDFDGDALPLPAGFVPQPVARHTGGGLIPAINTTGHAIGAWQFIDGREHWLDFPALSGAHFPYLPDFPATRFAWSGDGLGNSVVAFKLPQSDESGPVQVAAMGPSGKEMWRRSTDAYPFTQPVGNVALIAVPDSDEVVLAADEVAADEPGSIAPTGVIHVEQFRIEEGGGTVTWPPVAVSVPR